MALRLAAASPMAYRRDAGGRRAGRRRQRLSPQRRRSAGQPCAGRRGGGASALPGGGLCDRARRRRPLRSAVRIGSKFTDSPLQPTFADVAILILLYTVAAERPRRISLPALAACMVLFAAVVVRYNPGGNTGQPRHQVEFFLVTALLYLLAPVSAWVLGDSMGYRRAYAVSLEERAVRAERERDAQAHITVRVSRLVPGRLRCVGSFGRGEVTVSDRVPLARGVTRV